MYSYVQWYLTLSSILSNHFMMYSNVLQYPTMWCTILRYTIMFYTTFYCNIYITIYSNILHSLNYDILNSAIIIYYTTLPTIFSNEIKLEYTLLLFTIFYCTLMFINLLPSPLLYLLSYSSFCFSSHFFCRIHFLSLSTEIIEGFSYSRYVNILNDLPNMIWSFANGTSISLVATNGIKQTFYYCNFWSQFMLTKGRNWLYAFSYPRGVITFYTKYFMSIWIKIIGVKDIFAIFAEVEILV